MEMPQASLLIHFLKWRVGLAGPEIRTTDAERECLMRHAAGKHRLAEVGVWHAGTARQLRAVMAADGTFYAIDPYQPGRLGISLPRLVAHGELGRVSNGRVVWIREQGVRASASDQIRTATPLDFVFIDSAEFHDALRVEWQAWAPLVGRGGIIALHDSLHLESDAAPGGTDMCRVRDAIFGDRRFRRLETIDSLTVLQRRDDVS
jgi:hypothetical protein